MNIFDVNPGNIRDYGAHWSLGEKYIMLHSINNDIYDDYLTLYDDWLMPMPVSHPGNVHDEIFNYARYCTLMYRHFLDIGKDFHYYRAWHALFACLPTTSNISTLVIKRDLDIFGYFRKVLPYKNIICINNNYFDYNNDMIEPDIRAQLDVMSVKLGSDFNHVDILSYWYQIFCHEDVDIEQDLIF